MNIIQKIFGTLFPPFRHSILRQEHAKLFTAIINFLPEDLNEIKQYTLYARFWSFQDWDLYQDFKYVSLSYGGDSIFKYKKRGNNYKISGLQIFSKLTDRFENIEILIKDNLICGLKIENSQYNVSEFDLDRINNKGVVKSVFIFPPNDIDILYESLNHEIKQKLNPEDFFEIEFNNRTFYSFCDLEDGNYLAVDKNLNVYSLVHDAKPMVSRMKISFEDILCEIAINNFDKEKHLEDRYRNRI